MDRACMPQTMRADPLCGERWQGLVRVRNRATNQAIDAETGQRFMDSVQEYPFL